MNRVALVKTAHSTAKAVFLTERYIMALIFNTFDKIWDHDEICGRQF